MSMETPQLGSGAEGASNPFALAERAELVVARIYDKLGSFFPDKSDVRHLYATLAREEREHAERIRLFAQMWSKRAQGEPPRLDTARVQRLVERAESFVAELDQLETVSQHDALKFAFALENDFGSVHAECMAAAKDPKLADFFGQLSEDDLAHAAVLAEARRGFRFDGGD